MSKKKKLEKGKNADLQKALRIIIGKKSSKLLKKLCFENWLKNIRIPTKEDKLENVLRKIELIKDNGHFKKIFFDYWLSQCHKETEKEEKEENKEISKKDKLEKSLRLINGMKDSNLLKKFVFDYWLSQCKQEQINEDKKETKLAHALKRMDDKADLLKDSSVMKQVTFNYWNSQCKKINEISKLCLLVFLIFKCYSNFMSYIKGNVTKLLFESSTGYKVGLFKVKEANGEDVEPYLNKTITFTGNFMPINTELNYQFNGKIINHQRYGVQFLCDSYETIMPSDLDGIVMYLSSGIFKGIGPKTAKALVDTFKDETINEIKNNNPLVSKVKGMNEKKARELSSSTIVAPNNQIPTPLWAPGFNDNRLRTRGQLQHMIAYIQDNPRRLAIKTLHRDLFTIQRGKEYAGTAFDTLGNISLLDRELQAVHVGSRWSAEEKRNYKNGCILAARQGIVLIGAFISEDEKAVKRVALEEKLPMIQLQENGFPELYKPAGEFFDACAEGRLLLMAPWPYHARRHTISREQCKALNLMAEQLAAR